MLKNKWAYGGLILLILLLITAIFAPWIAPYDPYEINLPREFLTPSGSHIMGCDANGADIFSRMIYGTRISLSIAAAVVLITACIGIFIGLFSGYYGGITDTIIMRIVDILLAFPGLLLAIALAAVLGPSVGNVILALSALGWVAFARLVRGQVIAIKEREFVMAAQTSGQSGIRIMFLHILPNIMSPVIVQATFAFAGVIISESSLSFLGLGAPPGTPSWGAMLSDGKQAILDAPHVSYFPGLAIMITVIAFNFVGDAFRDILDPKSKRR